MNHRTLIYARVSTEDQVEKYGLPVQFRACRDYAQAHGLSVIEEIADEGVSGTTLDRPGLAKVRHLVRSGEADVVLMLDVDRLSRELAHLCILKPEIEQHARLEFVASRFEDSPSGRMFFGIRGVIAQYERELVRERTMRGKRERAARGLVVGGRVCYGYRYAAGLLLPDPERAPVAQQIYAWFDAGFALRAIARRLREQGAPTWSGKKWGHSSVHRILTNETYAGVAHYGTFRRAGKLLRLRNREEERIALQVPPLVDRACWERVQRRLAENAGSRPGRPSSSFLLRGILYCSCGRRMCGEKSRKHHAYRCSGRDALRVSGEHCRASVHAGKLDALVWQQLLRAFTDVEALEELLREEEEALRQADPESRPKLAAQVKRLKGREEAALALLLDPDFAADRPKLKSEYREAQQARMRAETQLAALAQQETAAHGSREWVREVVALIAEDLESLTEQAARQSFVQRAVTRADWDGEEVTMHCFLDREMATPSGRYERRPRRPPTRASPCLAHEHRGNRAKTRSAPGGHSHPGWQRRSSQDSPPEPRLRPDGARRTPLRLRRPQPQPRSPPAR